MKEREKILKPELKVSPREVSWYFIEDYYDGPISGLAIYQGRVRRFCAFPEDIPEQHIYVLHELSEEELARELREKEKFESMVGTHWSFDEHGEPLDRVLRSDESRERYYREQEANGAKARTPEPGDRPVLAWFDARKS